MSNGFNFKTKTTVNTTGNDYLYSGNFQAIIDRKLAEVFPPFCKKRIQSEIKKRPEQQYTLSIDNELIEPPDLKNLERARKRVIVSFVAQAFDLAIEEFAGILAKYYKTRGGRFRFSDRLGGGLIKETDPQVVMFYGGDNKSSRRIRSRADIETMEPGDYILLTSSNPWQVYLNTKGKARRSLRVHPLKKDIKNFRGGFFALAARRIRQKLGLQARRNRSQSPLWVGAVRSRAVLEAIGPPSGLSAEGLENWNELRYLGAWAIMIKRNNTAAANRIFGS